MPGVMPGVMPGAMGFLGCVARRAGLRWSPGVSPLARTSARCYSSEPTQEKNVPYEKTLKQQGGASAGPTKPLPRSEVTTRGHTSLHDIMMLVEGFILSNVSLSFSGLKQLFLKDQFNMNIIELTVNISIAEASFISINFQFHRFSLKL